MHLQPFPTGTSPSSEIQQNILQSVAASIELAIHQIAAARDASAVEILREAIREARGEPLVLQ